MQTVPPGEGWTPLDCVAEVLGRWGAVMVPDDEQGDTPALEAERAKRAYAAVRHLEHTPREMVELALQKKLGALGEARRAALREWLEELGKVDAAVIARFAERKAQVCAGAA